MTAAEAAPRREQVAAKRLPAVLADRWEIDLSAPAPEFDRASAQAFDCRDRQAPARPLVALLCVTGLPFRAAPARLLARKRVPGLLKLQWFGPFRPDPDRPAAMALVYDRPPAGAVMLTACGGEARGRETEPWRRLLQGAAATLRALAGLRVTHRGIRPGNLWSLGGAEGDILFGDGLCGPAGYDQPPAFETIERAMADQAARGEGGSPEDVFALGVTALAVAAGVEPGRGRTEDELLAARLHKGSYLALTEGLRVPVPLVEPLRGMLADDPVNRWSPRDLSIWVDGGRPRTPIARPKPSPEAPFVFDGKAQQDTRALAAALTRNVPEATRAIRGGGLASWLRSALHDDALAKRMCALAAGARSGAWGTPANADEALVARAALMLDPSAPIRYRGVAFAADGIGPALSAAFAAGTTAQALVEAILLDLPAFCRQSRPENPVPGMQTDAPNFAPQLRDPRIGFGIERCLYETNPGQACLSPLVRDGGVFELADLLPALEEAASTEATGGRPLDRHIAAFIAARGGAEAQAMLPALAESDAAASAAAMLDLLALVQSRHPGGALPNLTSWVGRLLPPVIASVRQRAARDALERKVRREIPSGDLCRLEALVADPVRRRQDREGFAAAAAAWEQAELEINRLQAWEPERRRRSALRGGRVAAAVAVSTAAISAGLSLLHALR